MPKHGKKGSGASHHHKREHEHMKNNQMRKALRRGRQARLYLSENDKSFISLNLQLNEKGLKLKQIMGDGNCLFRALADQFEQDHTKHWQYRAQVCQFILDNAPDFRPWVEDEMTLEAFIRELSKDGVFGGNETLVAFARLRNCDIVIHQLDELPWVIEAVPGMAAKIALHLAYHNDEDHYSSVVPVHFGEQERPPTVKVTTHSQPKEFKSLQQSQHEIKYHTRDSDISKTDLNSNLPQSKPMQSTGANALPEFDDIFSQVFLATGCQDNSTICQAIEENNWEAQHAIIQVLQIMSIRDDVDFGVSSDDKPSGGNILIRETMQAKLDYNEPKEKQKQQSKQQQQQHPKVNHPSQKQQGPQVLSNKKRKELAKAERKSRRLESQKKDKPGNGNPRYFDDDDDFNGDFQGLAI